MTETRLPPPDIEPGQATAARADARRAVRTGYLFAAVGAILFSTKAVIIKLAYAHSVGGQTIDAETLLALRMGLALPVYAAIGAAAVRDRLRRAEALPEATLMLRAGAVGALGYWLASYTDFLGLEYITAQFERLILFTYPLFVVLFGAVFFGQRIRRRALYAFAVSYAGLAIIFTDNLTLEGGHVAIGTAWVLAAAIAFAFYQLLARETIPRIGPRLFTCIAMSGAALGAFVQFLLTHPARDILVGPVLLGYGFLIAIVATVLPSFFLSAALHRISAQANSAIGTVSPLATIVLAAIVLGERMTGVAIFGTALVMAGVGWFTLADRT